MAEGILLIEDNETHIRFLQAALDKVSLGHLLQVVRDGQQAIDYLSGEKAYSDRTSYPLPQLVLLDLKLPGMPGLEVLQWIRSRPEFHDIIVVVLTCSDQPSVLTQAYHLGANSVLTKPSKAEDMPQLIKSMLEYWRK